MPAYTPPGSGTGVTIGGVAVTTPRPVTPRRLIPHVRRGIPSFSFDVIGGPLPTGTDPYLGQAVQVYINATLRFTGDVVRRDLSFNEGVGWTRTYQCLGLRNRGDKVCHTDSNDGADQSAYNVAFDNQSAEYIAARAGRTVGQILTDVLTMPANAVALNGYGIGNYTGLPSAPVLPSATVTDLAALTLVWPSALHVGGEKLLGAIDGFLSQVAPFHAMHIEPDGMIRIRDVRLYTNTTLTLNTDPIAPTPLSRDLTEAFQRVVVRGQQIAEMYTFRTALGTLLETPFQHDSLSIAAAKAAWTPNDYFQQTNRWEGTCTCPDTQHVVLTPSPAMGAVVANYWDQTATGHRGNLALTYQAGSSITMICQRGCIASTSYSGSGTLTLTLDRALPHLLFDHFVLTGTRSNPSAVWTEYALPSWAAGQIARQSTYPYPWTFGGGTAQSNVSSPMGTVCYSLSHSPPYSEASAPIEVDQGAGTVRFGYPTFLAAGSKPPDDVRALVPIWTGVNLAVYPADIAGVPQYSGNTHTVEGLSQTLTVTVRAWRDPANLTAMTAYASDLLDSVKDPIVEGNVTYYGLYTPALTPGIALSIAGNGYTTGWESAAVAVIEAQIEWCTAPGQPLNYVTTMRCSSRRAHFTDAAFAHPDRTGVTFDFGNRINFSGATS